MRTRPRVERASAALPNPKTPQDGVNPTPPPRKDTVHPTSLGAPAEPHTAIGPATAARPVVAPREPGPSGLTADEIRRIVLDVLG